MTSATEPSLFDLSGATESQSEPSSSLMDDLPLFDDLEKPEAADGEQLVAEQPAFEFDAEPEADAIDPSILSEPRPNEGPATLTDRLGAALLDLAVMAAAAVALAGGAALLGAAPQLSDWPLIAIPWLLFSFLYHVMPMAFWGQTPGMAFMSLTARTLDNRPLSLGQAIRRWLATMATAALLGIPGLLALSGRSATDRLSQSVTRWNAPPVASQR